MWSRHSRSPDPFSLLQHPSTGAVSSTSSPPLQAQWFNPNPFLSGSSCIICAVKDRNIFPFLRKYLKAVTRSYHTSLMPDSHPISDTIKAKNLCLQEHPSVQMQSSPQFPLTQVLNDTNTCRALAGLGRGWSEVGGFRPPGSAESPDALFVLPGFHLHDWNLFVSPPILAVQAWNTWHSDSDAVRNSGSQTTLFLILNGPFICSTATWPTPCNPIPVWILQNPHMCLPNPHPSSNGNSDECQTKGDSCRTPATQLESAPSALFHYDRSFAQQCEPRETTDTHCTGAMKWFVCCSATIS